MTALISTEESARTRASTSSTYVSIASPWIALGYAVVPTRGRGNKEPAASFWGLTARPDPFKLKFSPTPPTMTPSGTLS